jgi:predicted nuclease of predicted toxin-antitoxin system
LIHRLAESFPNSNHVYHLGLDRVEDRQVWQHAKTNDFTIVTKDGDYNELLILLGFNNLDSPWQLLNQRN